MHQDFQHEHKLYGFYRGIVLKHLSNGKCKIWIPAVYPEEWKDAGKVDMLPSAEQASSLEFGACNGNGIFSYPNINAIVWCFFENGDQNFPVYFASTLGGEDAKAEWNAAMSTAGKPPNDAGVHHVQVKNTHVYLHEAGKVEVKTESNDGTLACLFTMDASGNITLDSSTTISLHAKSIKLDASTQIDLTAPNIKTVAEIESYVKSKAINLDSSEGKTTISSYAPYSYVNPATTIF